MHMEMWIIMLDSVWTLLSTLPKMFFFSIKILQIKQFCFPEVGTNKVFENALRKKTQRLFKPLKAQNKRRTLNIFSEAQRNFRNKLYWFSKSVTQLGNEIFIPSQSTPKVLQLSVNQTM